MERLAAVFAVLGDAARKVRAKNLAASLGRNRGTERAVAVIEDAVGRHREK
jgi:hypothetical protein